MIVPNNDRREIFGWMMYDWANSAFQTTVVTVLAGPYLTGLAQSAVGENGIVLRIGPWGAVTAKSLFPYCVSASVALQVFVLPLLGAIADYTQAKKRLMAAFCYAGAAATCLLFFASGRRYLFGAVVFVVANLCFGASIVLYNAFLNDIATDDRRDAVSSRGFALGYLGGGLLLAINLATIANAAKWGFSTALAVRLSLLSAGLWWGGFSVVTFSRLRVRAPGAPAQPARSMFALGFSSLRRTFRHLRALPQTRRYLIAYMAYNDGIQTVIAVASVVLAQELFVAKGLPVDNAFLIELILMIQIVAIAGALAFERIARIARTKAAVLASLFLWIAVVAYAYAYLNTRTDAWIMGAAIAVVLGGSQALSRSLFSVMIPAGSEASFFGLYEISERGTSWIGPLIFGLVVGATNSYRQAILSVVILFAIGIAVLAATDVDEAVLQLLRSSRPRIDQPRAGDDGTGVALIPHVRRVAKTLGAWVLILAAFGPTSAAAQTEGRFALGANYSQDTLMDPEGRSVGHIGILWRFGQGQDGWGWAYGFPWFSSHLDTMVVNQPVELGELHVRPFMAGYGYSKQVRSARITTELLGGYAFSSFQLDPRASDAYRTRLGATSLAAHVSNTFTLEPQASIWFNASRKVGVNISVGYIVAHPTLSMTSSAGTERWHVNGNLVTLGVGAVYSLF